MSSEIANEFLSLFQMIVLSIRFAVSLSKVLEKTKATKLLSHMFTFRSV